MLNSFNNSPEQQHGLPSLKQLLYNHPFVCCGGLWATLVILGALATLGLFSPGSIEQEASQPSFSPTTVQESVPESPTPMPVREPLPESPTPPTVRESTPKQDLPLWLFGAVALGCAGGSFLLAQVLTSSAQRSQGPRRLKTVGTTRTRGQNPPKRRRSVPRTPQSVGSPSSFQIPKQQPARTAEQRTQITVLPPEQSHHLDGGKENLSEMMDLRKRYSLGSLMRNK
jgi:hypothetical protein